MLAGVAVVKTALASASSLSLSTAAAATVYLVPLAGEAAEVQTVPSSDSAPARALPVESVTATEVRVPPATATRTGSLKPAAVVPSAGVTVITATEVFGVLVALGVGCPPPPPEPAPEPEPPEPPAPVVPAPAPLSALLVSLQAASSSTGAPTSPASTPRRLQLLAADRP